MNLEQDFFQLNVADYLIITVVITSTLISLIRGASKEVVSLVIWVVGLLLAIKFYMTLAVFLEPYIANVALRSIISFVGIFLSVLIFGMLFNYALSLIIVKTGLSGFDRLLGMLFGCARGVLLVAVVLLLFSTTSFVNDDWWQGSVLIPHLKFLMDWLKVFLPQKITSLANVVN